MSEIVQWSQYDMEQRQRVLQQVKNQISTHDCPSCGGPAYCAMEAGKSANLCWCMDVTRDEGNPEVAGETCLCRRCLTKD